MRRLVLLLTLIGLVASACASSAVTLDAAAPKIDDEIASTTTELAADVSVTPDPVPAPVVYETGRQALEASQGKPYVLWFWAPN